MISKKWAMGVAGAAALLLSAATQAQAGIDLTFNGDEEGNSFRMDFSASPTSGDTAVSSAFNNIKAGWLTGVSFTVTAGTFNITNSGRFEDNGSGNTLAAHDAIVGFAYDAGNDGSPTGANGWAQSSFTPGPVFGTEVRGASVNTVNAGDRLDFGLWFENDLTDGTHFFVEFYNGNVFVTGYEIKRKDGSTTSGTARGFESVNYTSPFVPLPGSVWSGLALMGGLGFMLARRRRNSIIA